VVNGIAAPTKGIAGSRNNEPSFSISHEEARHKARALRVAGAPDFHFPSFRHSDSATGGV